MGDVRLVMAADSVVGNRYAANFDVLHLDPARSLVVVADGMGDSRGSAVAGRTAVDTFVRELPAEPTAAGLRALMASVQQRVRAAGAELSSLTGCTLTAFVAAGRPGLGPGVGQPGPGVGRPGVGAPVLGEAWIVQIGDSRAYRLRGGQLELLTVDHTAAWLGAINGWYPADSPQAHAARYRLMRYVGHPAEPEPDLLNISLLPGDIYLVCSDGLAEQVPYERLAAALTEMSDPSATVSALLADSLSAGGHDNATVAVIRVEEAE
jgi:serine/threonine protein phosphatase PrpC